MGGIGFSGTTRCYSEIRVLACYQRGIFLVFPIVAVQAEVLPVTTVGWVIVVIVVLMMDSQFMQICAGKFPAAPGADPRVQAQRLLSVPLHSCVRRTPSACYHLVELVRVDPGVGLA